MIMKLALQVKFYLSYQTGTTNNDAELEAKIVAKKIQDMIGNLQLDNFDKTTRPC